MNGADLRKNGLSNIYAAGEAKAAAAAAAAAAADAAAVAPAAAAAAAGGDASAARDSRKRKAEDEISAGDTQRTKTSHAKTQIDHTFEVQEFNQHLAHVKGDMLPADAILVNKVWNQEGMNTRVKNIMNHHDNLAPVDAAANGCLGQIMQGNRCMAQSDAAGAALKHLDDKTVQYKRETTAKKLSEVYGDFAQKLENNEEYKARSKGSTKFTDRLKNYADVDSKDGLVAETKRTHEEAKKTLTETKEIRDKWNKMTEQERHDFVTNKPAKWDQ
ncbi:hypothetical protein HDU67_000192, partial [Dinochytrium kinnereticum]